MIFRWCLQSEWIFSTQVLHRLIFCSTSFCVIHFFPSQLQQYELFLQLDNMFTSTVRKIWLWLCSNRRCTFSLSLFHHDQHSAESGPNVFQFFWLACEDVRLCNDYHKFVALAIWQNPEDMLKFAVNFAWCARLFKTAQLVADPERTGQGQDEGRTACGRLLCHPEATKH